MQLVCRPIRKYESLFNFGQSGRWLLSIYTCQSGVFALVPGVVGNLSHVHNNLFIVTSTHSMHAVRPLCILCLMALVFKTIRVPISNIEANAQGEKRKKNITSVSIQMLRKS